MLAKKKIIIKKEISLKYAIKRWMSIITEKSSGEKKERLIGKIFRTDYAYKMKCIQLEFSNLINDKKTLKTFSFGTSL